MIILYPSYIVKATIFPATRPNCPPKEVAWGSHLTVEVFPKYFLKIKEAIDVLLEACKTLRLFDHIAFANFEFLGIIGSVDIVRTGPLSFINFSQASALSLEVLGSSLGVVSTTLST